MRRRFLALGVLVVAIAAVVGYAAQVSSPVYGDTSKSYNIGYEVVLQVSGQNFTIAAANASMGQGPRVGAVQVVNDVGVVVGADNYTYAGVGGGSSNIIVQPPPKTQTVTSTYTYTTTLTKTVTGPGGKTTIVTTVETVTVPPGQGPASHRRALLLGLGALAFLLLLLARR